jgi:hypothetical protein
MPEFNDLIEIGAVKDFLGMEPGDSTLDAPIALYIQWVSDAIQRRAGQPIKSGSKIFTFTGEDSDAKILHYWPVAGVTKLEQASLSIGSTFSDIGSGFDVIEDTGCYYLRFSGVFDNTWRYRATLTVGHAIVPGEIQKVALEMVAQLVRDSDLDGVGKGRSGLKTITEADTTSGITNTLQLLDKNPEWTAAIARHSIVVI